MASAAAAPAARTRFTYVLLFRVVVVSLLLVARLFEEAAAPSGVAFGFTAGLGLVVLCYASSIFFSLWLRRSHSEMELRRLAAAQSIFDLLAATALVHFSGGAESQLAFVYLLVVAVSGLSFTRGALWVAVAAAALYTALLVTRQLGFLPRIAQVYALPVRELARSIMLNAVAILATGVLASRLAVELKRAGASLVTKNAELDDLATLYADVVRSLSSGLITLAADGRVATANQAASVILGLSESDIQGRPIEDLIPGMDELRATPRAARRAELAFLDSGRRSRRLGVTISPLVDARDVQVGQIVSFQDLTELREMEEAVTRQKRLAAIGRLAAGIAHEIRNPLAAISGSIELLVASGIGEASADDKELAQIVLREVARLNALITQLLAFARPRELELQSLDLAELMRELVQVYKNDRRLGDASIELYAEQAVVVSADAGQLRQVVWNLLRNASEAAPDRPIHVSVAHDSQHARLVIADEGPGISDEHLSRIFEPFFSTKEGGTGLGLPTVHRIVEEHHGSVTLSRNPSGGTSAVMRLPLQAA